MKNRSASFETKTPRTQKASRQRALRTSAAAALLSTVALLSSSAAQAGAYYVGEFGARSIARGGANIVNPGDGSAMWLNPAALSNATGPQLSVDLNTVLLYSAYVRDCGRVPEGCAPEPIERSYRGGDRRFVLDQPRGQGENVGPADVNALGNINTPSRFDGVGAVQNTAGPQLIPRIYASMNLDSFGLDGVALGAFLYAPSAGDYAFGEDTPTRYTLIDRDLLEVFYGVAASYRFQHWFAIGGAFQFVTSGVTQRLRLTADPNGNEDPDYDIQVKIDAVQHFIPSGALGVWSNPLHGLGIGDLEIAASVQLPRFVQASGPITLESFGPRFQDEFGGLVDINQEGATANAEFTIPPFYRAGLKYGIDDVTGDGDRTFGFDVEAAFVYEQWSLYDHVFLEPQGLTFAVAGGEPETLPPLIQPKDWNDSFSLRLGGTLAFFDRMLELHGGGFYETSAIPDETYSIELVDGDKAGVGVGASGKLFGVRLDVGYSHILVFDRTIGTDSIVTSGNVESPLNNGETRTKVAMGTYSANYNMFNVALTVAFDDMFSFGVYGPGGKRSRSRVEEPAAPAPQKPQDESKPQAPERSFEAPLTNKPQA